MPDYIERAARVLALTGDYDGCFERLDAWESATPEQRECGEVEEPMLTDADDAEWWRKRARTLAAAGLLAPAGAAWHTDPPDADVDLLRRAAASERTAERHWPADMLAQAADTIERLRTDLAANPDADVAERIAQAWDEGYQAHEDEYWCGDGENPYRATPPVAATGIDLIEHHLNIWRRYHKGLSLESSKEDWLDLLEEDPNMIEDRNWGDAKGAPLTEVARFKAWLTTAPVDDEQAATGEGDDRG